ncbi:hypothetical protein [Haloarchaeobius salinus]|uniref:hypothetical protein n=1 Tax=Haloarchaeobius salinus TaxID=1198298 RepID=UPI0021092C4D|nr:hypothetical protein [Haloarchaeobius salinus]
MREATPGEIRRVADRLRGRAERFDSQADEHHENEEYGLSGRKSDAAALDRRHAEIADELADYLDGGGETDE